MQTNTKSSLSQLETGKDTEKKPFWKKHLIKLLLLSFLLISILWGYFGNKSTISKYQKELISLEEKHQSELADLKTKHLRLLSNTLALAVRSELLNENMSQIDQYFKQTVKLFEVNQILLIDPKSKKIILSTDKKVEDEVFQQESVLSAGEAEIHEIEGKIYISSPIMGLNSQLAVMVLEIN